MARRWNDKQQIAVPALFYDDHGDRALPTPAEWGRKGKHQVWIRLYDKHTPSLLSDAEFYIDKSGPDAAPPSVVASARRTVATLSKYDVGAKP
jgi:hypothetical protein